MKEMGWDAFKKKITLNFYILRCHPDICNMLVSQFNNSTTEAIQ